MTTLHILAAIENDLPAISYSHAHKIYHKFMDEFSHDTKFRMHVEYCGIRTLRFFSKTHQVLLNPLEKPEDFAIAIFMKNDYVHMLKLPQRYGGMPIGIIIKSERLTLEEEIKNSQAMPRII